MSIAFPYRLAPSGRTATNEGDRHVVDMLYQLLFTSPGERVNRPDFGCGLLDLAFEPAAVTLATGLTAVITASVQQWLGDVVEIGRVDVEASDNELSVTLGYRVRATGSPDVAVFTVPRST
jgi:phage baseplate assembly protein W